MLLRPATPLDEPFLRELYADTRRDELAATGWDDRQLAEFLDMQFVAQRTDYERRFPGADHDIVLDGPASVGRIWVHRTSDEIRLLDLAILSAARRRGIGTGLITRLQDEAADARLPLRHSVVKENTGALRLYHRLGFTIIGDVPTHHAMEWTPGA